MISRQLVLALGLGVIALSACKDSKPPAAASTGSQITETPPARAAGLWRFAATLEGVPGVSGSTLCLDEAADKKLSWWGDPLTDLCEVELHKQPDGSWAFSSSCQNGAISLVREGVGRGDFTNAYSLDGKLTFNGSPDPQLSGTKSFTLSATHAGACPAGMAPGEMELPNGQKVNLLQLGQAQ